MNAADTLGIWGLVISVVGLMVSGVGFWFTIAQLRRTATATEASNQLLAAVGERMHHNHLLVVLPQLHVIADELDAAVQSADSRAATRALVAYSRVASQVSALLDSSDAESDRLLAARLQASSTVASSAKGQIVTGARQPLAKLLREFLADLSSILNDASALVARYQMKVA